MSVVTREYNKIEYPSPNPYIRKSSSTERLKDEIMYYVTIQNKSYIARMFPSLYNWNVSTGVLELELIGYESLSAPLVGFAGGIPDSRYPTNWTELAKVLLDRMQVFHADRLPMGPYDTQVAERSNNEMFILKTEREYLKLFNEMPKQFDGIKHSDVVIVNNQECHSLDRIWPTIVRYIQTHLIDVPSKYETVIHGDMCFSNILCGYNVGLEAYAIKFIDPRGSFGRRGIYGNPIYDYAKLLHSYEGGYEYIINDEFTLKYDGNVIDFEFNNDRRELVASQMNPILFKDELSYRHAKLVSGLIFIGMCARHYDSGDRQLIMYCTGLQILNQIYKEVWTCKF